MRPLALLVLCSCGRLAFDPVGDARPDAEIGGPVLHFKFDGTDVRTEANGRDATCTLITGRCPTTVPGRVGAGAAQLTGSECMHVADDPVLRPARFTVATWVSIDTNQPMTFIGKAYMGATTSANSYELALDDTGMIGAFATPNSVLVPLQLGWRHIAATVDGTTLAAYVDGSLSTP